MKKIAKLFLLITMCILLNACSKKEIYNCTTDEVSWNESFKIETINKEINKITFSYEFNNEMFGIEDITNLSSDDKESIELTVLTMFGIDDTTKNIDYKIKYDNQITLSAEVKVNKDNSEVLKNLGYDLDKYGTNIDLAITKMNQKNIKCTK